MVSWKPKNFDALNCHCIILISRTFHIRCSQKNIRMSHHPESTLTHIGHVHIGCLKSTRTNLLQCFDTFVHIKCLYSSTRTTIPCRFSISRQKQYLAMFHLLFNVKHWENYEILFQTKGAQDADFLASFCLWKCCPAVM